MSSTTTRDAGASRRPTSATWQRETAQGSPTDYQEFNAKRRSNIPETVLWPFWAPDPEGFYRWRVQLDCGCITEALLWGDKKLPTDNQWFNFAESTHLPAGQLICRHNDSPPAPYREIVEWGDRREVSFAADPVEPREGMDAETWALIRHDTPYTRAFWKVTLSCGHTTEVISDLYWKPADGPRHVSFARQQEMLAEFQELWGSDPQAQTTRERQHMHRMIEQGWPSPPTEHLCYTCPNARFILAYQRHGWLVPPKPKPGPPKPPPRATLERRLRKAEADADQLRIQLAQLEEQP